jgi:general secretion pathway protein B
MSFILDALKKSEAERQRQDTPGIASIPAGGQQKGGLKWVWIIIGLLVINLAVVSGLALRKDATVEAPLANLAEPAAEAAVEIVREGPRDATASTTAPVEAPVSGEVRPQSESLPVTEPLEAISAGLPTFNDLRARGVLQLPDMHLDIHVYSGDPADRFVFVNMSKYTESATLSEGPVVREITTDGVVLDHQGTRFLLPRE